MENNKQPKLTKKMKEDILMDLNFKREAAKRIADDYTQQYKYGEQMSVEEDSKIEEKKS